jgi:hypothetical protein
MNRFATVWTILEITHDLANARMVLIGDRLISIRGREMLEYTDEEVKTLMQTPLNGECIMQTKPGNREVNRQTFDHIRSAAVARLDNAHARLVLLVILQYPSTVSLSCA